jgi:hypothetical protein
MMRRIPGLLIGAALIGTLSCGEGASPSTGDPAVAVGALYSVHDAKAGFRVAKVLVVDERAVHVRVYKNRFEERPVTIDAATLSLGTINDKDGFGMGHLPMTRSAFAAWEPVLLQRGSVEPAELEGYEIWRSASR